MNNEERLIQYEKAIALVDGLVRKGKTVPYTSDNGHMFSFVNKEGQVGIRLSKEDQKSFLENFSSGKFMSHGSVMKDYVLVPDALLSDKIMFSAYLKTSWAFVKSLPPKPTKKSK